MQAPSWPPPGLAGRAGPCPNTPAPPHSRLDGRRQPRRTAQAPPRARPGPPPPPWGPGVPEPPFRGSEAGRTEGGVAPATAYPDSRLFGGRARCRCWDCQGEDTERSPADPPRETACQDLEEQLEQPLPLRSDSDSRDCGPPAPPHARQQRGQAPGRFRGPLCIGDPPYGQPPQPHSFCSCQDGRPWMQNPLNWLRSGADVANHGISLGGFSLNAPQFCLPPADCLMQVNTVNWDHPGLAGVQPGECTRASNSQQKRKTLSLLHRCRNIFITYSVDTASTMIPFSEFLTQQGFRPAIDIYDSPITRMDINQWIDSYLEDPSVLIIIAISSGYKADIARPGRDRHGLHTKYIYSAMQNEFIQQGSLNYQFVPVLFHDASQSHVPGWLQNTRVFRWPQDKEHLLLRLLREEQYVAPPVPEELPLFIKPVALSTHTTS